MLQRQRDTYDGTRLDVSPLTGFRDAAQSRSYSVRQVLLLSVFCLCMKCWLLVYAGLGRGRVWGVAGRELGKRIDNPKRNGSSSRRRILLLFSVFVMIGAEVKAIVSD